MRNDRQSERELFRNALGPGADCLPVEKLEILMDAGTKAPASADLAQHVQTCAHCRTELELLRSFHSAEARPDDEQAVRQVTERLRSRSQEIFARPSATASAKTIWWKTWFSLGSYSTAKLAFAAVLGILVVGLQLRHSGPPQLGPVVHTGEELLRSYTIAILAPAGDLQKVPERVEWQPVAGAMKYEVRLLEVNRTEMWKMDTDRTYFNLPSNVQARIVPGKTINVQVSAFDAAGRRLAESELVPFRLLQNVYSR